MEANSRNFFDPITFKSRSDVDVYTNYHLPLTSDLRYRPLHASDSFLTFMTLPSSLSGIALLHSFGTKPCESLTQVRSRCKANLADLTYAAQPVVIDHVETRSTSHLRRPDRLQVISPPRKSSGSPSGS